MYIEYNLILDLIIKGITLYIATIIALEVTLKALSIDRTNFIKQLRISSFVISILYLWAQYEAYFRQKFPLVSDLVHYFPPMLTLISGIVWFTISIYIWKLKISKAFISSVVFVVLFFLVKAMFIGVLSNILPESYSRTIAYIFF